MPDEMIQFLDDFRAANAEAHRVLEERGRLEEFDQLGPVKQAEIMKALHQSMPQYKLYYSDADRELS